MRVPPLRILSSLFLTAMVHYIHSHYADARRKGSLHIPVLKRSGEIQEQADRDPVPLAAVGRAAVGRAAVDAKHLLTLLRADAAVPKAETLLVSSKVPRNGPMVVHAGTVTRCFAASGGDVTF